MPIVFKKKEFNKRYVKLANHKKGDILVEGRYLGITPNKFGGENFEFQPETGSIISINGSGKLSYMMKSVSEGDIVRLIYLGKSLLTDGPFKGKEAHDFEMEVAENTEEQVESDLD